MKKRDKFIVCDLCRCKNSLNDALANDDYDKIGKDKKFYIQVKRK